MLFRKTTNKFIILIASTLLISTISGCSTNKNVDISKQNEVNNVHKNKTSNDVIQNKKSPIALEKAVVAKHIDGDTSVVKLENGKEEKVRLIGVNCPESTKEHEPYGKEASDYTKSQLIGRTVYLEKDVSDKDQYGRLLRYVWLEPPVDTGEQEVRTKMYNAILALNGYAVPYTFPPDVKYRDYFRQFSKEARTASKGLWKINPKGTTRGDKF